MAGYSPETPLAAHSVLFLVLRRLRAPLLVIVASYAVSVTGLALIPGIDAEGRPTPPMSVFHAFYFVSYTATTIGFGELPAPFSDAQRLWVLVIIHLSVIAWTYALFYVLSLFQDQAFRRAVAHIRVAGDVSRLSEPFHLICGASDTGQRLVRLLDRMNMRFVVIDEDEQLIEALELEDLHVDAPILNGDAAAPQTLLTAGLRHPMCRNVLAVTRSDRTNLAVATAARLLNRKVTVIAGATSPLTVASMRAFGTHHVISPFDTFAENLVLAMRAPGCYRLLDWLTAPLDAELQKEHEPPRGPWVVCGYGRFGQAVTRRLLDQELSVTAIDTGQADADADPIARLPALIHGTGTEPVVLERAGVAEAAGIVAATDDDVTNLAIAALARTYNAKVFVVLRQNEAANQPLFDGFRADLVMKPSEIIADECVALITTPLLERFLAVVRRQTDAWGDEVIHQLRKRCGTRSPRAWTLRIDAEETPAACEMLSEDERPLLLGDLLRAPADRQQRIEAQALMVLRDGRELLMPGDDLPLRVDDRILFAGRSSARRQLDVTACDANVLRYACTGRDTPGGWLFMPSRKPVPAGPARENGEGRMS